MEPSTSTGLKRKCISPNQEEAPIATKPKIDGSINILDLSDCILLEILKFLDATSLYLLGETCTRLSNLVQDQSLWVHIEGRSEPNTFEKVNFCWKNAGQKTKSLKLSGYVRSKVFLSSKIFDSNMLSSLTVLALEHQSIKYCRLNEFPSSLKEISFRHSYIPNHPIFFRYSEKQMANLRVLILDHCKWLDANSFTSWCKYPKLEILSLYMCKKLTEDEIANVTLAGTTGFKTLKVADLRFTAFGEVFIRAFYSNPSIQIVYFQCYGTSYVTERYKRKLDIINGVKMKEYSHMSDDEDNNIDQEWVRKRFNAKKTQKYHTQTIKDNTMVVYKRTQKIKGDRDRPSSVLYKYPYDVCTCGFYSKPTRASVERAKTSWDADEIKTKLDEEVAKQRVNKTYMKGGEIYFVRPNDSKLCNKIVYDSCMMPDWCHIEASPSGCIHKWLFKRTPRNDFEISMMEHVDKHYLSQLKHRCALGAPCACLLTPLCANSIVVQSPEVETCMSLTYHQGWGVQGQCDNEKLLRIVANHITDIRNSNDSEMVAQHVGPSIVRSIIDTIDELKTYEILEDDAFSKEISRIIHDLAMIIEFDAFHVIAHHACCFDDLNRHISGLCDVKDCFKFFFANLTNSVRGDFTHTIAEIDSSELQLDREELEREQLSPRLGYTDSRRWHISAIELENMVQIRPHFRDVNVINQKNVGKEFTTVLGELSLRGYTHVTDRTLMVLKDLDLGLLDVTGTNVTAEGAQQFLTYNPQCWLMHETTCVCRPSLHF